MRKDLVRFCPGYLASGTYETAAEALQAIGFGAERAVEIATHERTVNGAKQLTIVVTHGGDAVSGLVVMREKAGWRLWQVWLDKGCDTRDEAEALIEECAKPYRDGEWDVLPCRLERTYDEFVAASRLRH